MEKRPDSPTVLRNGTATPYLAIFNPYNSVIRDPKNGLPIGTFVTEFQYVYDEEKTDHGSINLDTDNPDLISLSELGYQQGLVLQWGYIYPDGSQYVGPIRRVIITGMKAGFTANGVHITLEFSDASILLKSNPAQHYDFTKGFVKYVEDLCKGVPIGISIVDYQSTNQIVPRVAHRITDNDTVSNKYPDKHNTGTKAEWATGSKFNAIDKMEIIQPPSVDIPNMVGVELLSWNSTTQSLTVRDPDNFRKVYLKEEMAAETLLLGTSRSKYYQLADIARSLSNGPYFVDSRDDQIVIHNLQNRRDIVKVYTYKGGYGELIEFTIHSKFVKASVEAKQSNNLNPDTKSLDTVMVQGVVDPDAGNPDGIDTYMVWPDLGTPFWNPKGGSIKDYPIEASNAPLVGQPAKQKKSSVEYHEHNDPIRKPVRADRPFSSVKEAKKWYTTHPGISQADIDEWFNSWQKTFESKRNSTAEGVEEITHQLDRIPPFILKKSITIAAEVNLENLGGSRGLKNATITESQTETFKNAIISGQIDLSRYTSDLYSRHDSSLGANSLVENAMGLRGTYIKNAETLLKAGGFTVAEVTRNTGESDAQYKHRKAENRYVSIKTEIEIQLNGVDIVAGADSINLPGSLGNDIVEKITDAVKAEATVIGDPSLESSMNVQIQNVSEKYSGLWYTKKVTHIMNSSGYLTKIEFVQRTVPISQVTIKSTLSKKDYAKDLLEAFKQAKESKSYKEVSRIEREAKQFSAGSKTMKIDQMDKPSTVLQRDPKTGKLKEAKLDMVSGDYITVDNRTIYTGNVGNLIQDLQKERDKLPIAP